MYLSFPCQMLGAPPVYRVMAKMKMKGWKKFAAVGERTWEIHGDMSLSLGLSERCVRCNRPMADNSDTLFLSLTSGGTMVRKPGSATCDTNMGMHPIGPGCAKRFAGYAFKMREW